MATDKEQPAVEEETGLDVDLGAVFDEVTAEPEPESKPEPEAPKAEDPKEPEAEKEPEKEPEPVSETPPEEPAEKEVVPPATWTSESKEKFSTLDPGLQQEILKREKDFAQGIQKNADAAKQAEEFDQIISPYRAMIAAEGATPPQAVANLLNKAYLLRTGTPEQKVDLILNLANIYGVDLSQSIQKTDEDEYVDPDIKTLRGEIASLKQSTQNQIQVSQNQQIQVHQESINAFAADPKHEHFEKVRGSMSVMLQGGLAQTLEEAYEKSMKLDPELSAALVQKQVKDAEQARIAKESEAAKKAEKAAGLKLTNEESGVVTPEDGTMEEDLAAAFDKAQAS